MTKLSVADDLSVCRSVLRKAAHRRRSYAKRRVERLATRPRTAWSAWPQRCEAPGRDARRLRRIRRSCVGGRDRPPRAQQGRSLTAADGEGDVERHRASLEQDGHAVAVLEVLRGLLKVSDRADSLPVDLPDHVSALDAGS